MALSTWVHPRSLARAAVALAATWLVACAADANAPERGDQSSWPVRSFEAKEPERDAPASAPPASEPAAQPAESGDAGANPAACSTAATAPACFNCCEAQSPSQAAGLWTTAFDLCLCDTPGACRVACGGSLCKGEAPSGICERCIDEKGGTCAAEADAACLANAQCAPLVECDRASGCAAKPFP